MLQRRRLLVVSVLVVLAIAGLLSRRGGPQALEADFATIGRQASLQSFVTASGEIVAERYADIGSSVMGRLVTLSVKEGDRVRAGQVLARIDPVQARSGADSASAALSALEADARGSAEQVRAAQADVAAATARATEARKAVERARELRTGGLTAQADLDAAEAQASAAAAQAQAATASLQRAEQARASAERRVAQGRAEQLRARDQLDKTEITAPVDGVVTRLDVEEGEMVVMGVQNQPGTILMTVSDLSAINAEVKVAEADVLRLKVGNPATVTLEALPGRTFTGTVMEIGASALPQAGQQAAASAREFKVTVRLQGDVATLFFNDTATTEMLVAEKKNVLTAPLQAVVQRPAAGGGADRVGVFVVKDGVATFQPVTTGVIGGLDIEVDGVAEGATIVSGPFQLLRELADGARVRARAATR